MLTAILELIYERKESRKEIVTSTLCYAEMIGDNCRAALAFEDAQDAEETLKSLQAESSIEFACVYTKEDRLLAQYQSSGYKDSVEPPVTPVESYKFEKNYFKLFRHIKENEEIIGTVYIQLNLSNFKREFLFKVGVVGMIMLVCSLIAYLVSFRLQHLISGPILSLTEIARSVTEKKDYSIRAWKQSNDEIGLLINSFNEMLEQIQQRDVALTEAKDKLETRVKERTAELTHANDDLKKEIDEHKRTQTDLEEAHERLIETAHKAGMAEVAADVLHNVGNVLNSINVTTTLITKQVVNSEISNLEKLAELVNNNMGDIGKFLTEDSKGKHVPVYLTEVSKCLTNEKAEIIDKLRILAKNVEHIKEIVSTQQSYAKISAVEVQTNVPQLIEDAIYINSAALERHKTTLTRHLEALPDIQTNKQKILQIIVNLINNAKYAVSGNGKEDKEIIIKLYQHGNDWFRIEVLDNGVGISKENLTKIFNHGFTTKTNGHGFGLHSGALAAKEMGGSLTAHSDGLGKGAKFIIELPFKPVRVTK
ncbi:MAG: HAMP domain-containing protein [Sedimentisphaerales bacterium]|nr:HAMP domain-containing protein [Sedimentisphaerales bacterium]